ncbi:MAG: 8-amino-7-oxononanoate synthase [Verrucomicrobiota bacterium]
MNDFEQQLEQQLAGIREQDLYRELRPVDSPQATRLLVGRRELLNFSSNDYLGLADCPQLKEAAKRAVDEFGAGSGASRLVCGSLAIHHQLDDALAAFKGAGAALSFSSGYATAMAALCALLDKDDILIIDKLVHACIVDGARLCGAKLRVFAHNDLNDLEKKLKWADKQRCAAGKRPRILIAAESVYSMDGDLAHLRDIVELKDKHGAWLLLDEAHGTGLYGEHRRGLAEACELAGRVEIQMGTLGKAIGAAGGYICGSRKLIDVLINQARSFIFSTAPVPAAAGAAKAGVEIIASGEGELRRKRLWALVDLLKSSLVGKGWVLPPVQSAIIPLVVGEESRAMQLAEALRESGIFVPAIRYPTVARGEARLRVTLSANHTAEEVDQLAFTMGALKARV